MIDFSILLFLQKLSLFLAIIGNCNTFSFTSYYRLLYKKEQKLLISIVMLKDRKLRGNTEKSNIAIAMLKRKLSFGGTNIIFTDYMYVYRVFISIFYKVNAFFGQKNYFSILKFYIFFLLRNGSGTFMNIWKKNFKDKNFCLKKPRTLGA